MGDDLTKHLGPLGVAIKKIQDKLAAAVPFGKDMNLIKARYGRYACARAYSHTHSHTHAHSHIHTHAHSHTLTLSHTHTLTHSRTPRERQRGDRVF